ncbi:hypothetical protein H5410_000660 [Solanum commersonii]|uniref:Uncharacterized protein n=1 Tax=Solanum commersonii TaxID=4109 RepID=A0A9J6AXX1_SOLCO|nr:hypothetical protein H5410_000660 [Solanum commersonii]
MKEIAPYSQYFHIIGMDHRTTMFKPSITLNSTIRLRSRIREQARCCSFNTNYSLHRPFALNSPVEITNCLNRVMLPMYLPIYLRGHT